MKLLGKSEVFIVTSVEDTEGFAIRRNEIEAEAEGSDADSIRMRCVASVT